MRSAGLRPGALEIITNSLPGELGILPEIVKLRLLRTADGLVFSWSAELAGWKLQPSVTPEANSSYWHGWFSWWFGDSFEA